jgi:hypothetical protein
LAGRPVPVLYRAGLRLLQAGLYQAAITHWTTTVESGQRIPDHPDHPDTITARANLASSYWQAGRTTDAITIEEQVRAGPDHPDTVDIQALLGRLTSENTRPRSEPRPTLEQ